MRAGRGVAGAVALALLAFAATTWLALEARDVAELRTRAPDGGWRVTRVWTAEADGGLWLEAATPEREWYRDVVRDPDVELVRAGRRVPWLALPVPGRAGHERVRSLLRGKYGWADAWVGLLQDTSRSVAVRLVPRASGAGPRGPG